MGSIPAGGTKTLNAAWYSQQTNKNNVTSGVWVPRVTLRADPGNAENLALVPPRLPDSEFPWQRLTCPYTVRLGLEMELVESGRRNQAGKRKHPILLKNSCVQS